MRTFTQRHRRSLVVASLVTVGVAVTSQTGAVAAVKSVVLGGKNSSSTTTSLSNPKGVPLALAAGAGKAPLTVNSSTKVTKLNADALDGLDASAFARTNGRTGYVGSERNEPAMCPRGTKLTGGGGFSVDETTTPESSLPLHYSGPAFSDDGLPLANSWQVFGPSNGTDYSLAVCYDPTGKLMAGALSPKAAKLLMSKAWAPVAKATR